MTDKNDEKLLDQYIDNLEKKSIEVPTMLEERIKERIDKVEIKKKSINPFLSKVLVASLLLVTLFSASVRFFPGFAAYAGNFPVLRIAVDWLQGDSGTEHARREGYNQIPGFTVEKDSYVLKFDNIMLDEDRLVMSIQLFTEDQTGYDEDKRLEVRYTDFADSGGLQQVEYETETEAIIEIREEKVFADNELREFLASNPEHINLEVVLSERGSQTIYEFGSIKIPINSEQILFSQKYSIETITNLEKGLLTLHNFTVSPTRMRLDVSFDMEDGYYFTSFENPRLMDAGGNAYQSEGLVSINTSDVERSMFFVPSIYFDDPHTEMYFAFDGVWVGSEYDDTFTLSLNDEYPKSINFMGEEIIIEQVSYRGSGNGEGYLHSAGDDLVIEIRKPENVWLENMEIDGEISSHAWSTGLDEDGNPRPHLYGLNVEYRDEYEVTLLFSGRLMDGLQEIKMDLE
ncbi:DUF4179 domain-containing protein [Dethiobacter alkaliphilus]|uniref:DUF4179 domain-containing protein n=1 Tax=Dethiobacter alkaliphilus AHT 1 TaxID=555088 RepID=C0GD77_DETAL|nr:DUF4179 domain-containing protein [Dethiobacter alkaliphilus]EEG78598.1 hypothetical protein DealDRAFT_0528 [Dethiobacter alkaliphilus AHT 1]